MKGGLSRNCKRFVRNPQLSSHGPWEKQLQSKCCQLFSSKRNPVAHSRIPRRGKNTAFFSSKIEARSKAKPSNGCIILTKHDTTVFSRNKGLSCMQVQLCFQNPEFLHTIPGRATAKQTPKQKTLALSFISMRSEKMHSFLSKSEAKPVICLTGSEAPCSCNPRDGRHKLV